jgi:molybdenum cofactor cytidylyltransferase
VTGVVLILAAGRGRRFGGDKRRARLPDGRTLLAATVARYAEIFDQVRVVLRAGEALPADCVRAGVEAVTAPRADRGMGASLADGVGACAGVPWLFVALGDMPWVEATTLRALRRAAEDAPEAGSPVIQPVHDDRPGHPVGFRAPLVPALACLDGDTGARPVVRAAERILRVPVDDPGIHRDADTPAALAAGAAIASGGA